jgi:hypothetical protein
VKGAGIQPFANASRAKCEKCLETLIGRADQGTLSNAALLLSPPFGDAGALKLLLDGGAEANARDPKGRTLLMLAASSDAILVDTVKSDGAGLNRHHAKAVVSPNTRSAQKEIPARWRGPDEKSFGDDGGNHTAIT